MAQRWITAALLIFALGLNVGCRGGLSGDRGRAQPSLVQFTPSKEDAASIDAQLDAGESLDGGDADSGDASDISEEIIPGPCCEVEARDKYIDAYGKTVETIFSRGRFYRFIHQDDTVKSDGDHGKDLTLIPRFVAENGPCVGKPKGECRIDAYSNHLEPHNDTVEFMIADGKFWSFTTHFTDHTVTHALENGKDLLTLARLRRGPCQGQAPFGCRIDTRSAYVENGKLTEWYTAYGKFWVFIYDYRTRTWSNGNFNGNSLASLSHYQGGPCQADSKNRCSFSSHAVYLTNPTSGERTESITAEGRLYNFYRGSSGWSLTAAQSNGQLLSTIPHLSAVCRGADQSTCTPHINACTGGSIACGGGGQCCASNETCLLDACCPKDRISGNQCCGSGQKLDYANRQCDTGCANPCASTCCQKEEVCIENTLCCDKSQVVNGKCCTGPVCGGQCCAEGYRCENDKCTSPPRCQEICKNGECCDGPGNACLGDACCPTLVCNGQCCAAGQTCSQGTCTDICSEPCGEYGCCDDATTCTSNGCCPDPQILGGQCCNTMICNGVCCEPGQDCSGEHGACGGKLCNESCGGKCCRESQDCYALKGQETCCLCEPGTVQTRQTECSGQAVGCVSERQQRTCLSCPKGWSAWKVAPALKKGLLDRKR